MAEPEPAWKQEQRRRFQKRQGSGFVGGHESVTGEESALGKVGRGLYGENRFRADTPQSRRYGYGDGLGDIREERFQERGNVSADRRFQLSGLDPIRQRALGLGGPSVAEQQMGRGLGAASQAVAQRAASARGQSRAAAQTAAVNAQGQLGGRAASDSALLRAQEQIAAQQLYQQGLGQMRGQDLQARGFGLEESKALEDQKLRAQEINAGITSGNAQRGQTGSLFTAAAVGGLLGLGSDVSQKDVYSRGMPSDYTLKEPAVVGQPAPGAQPVTDVGGTPLPMYLNVPPPPTNTEADAAQKQLEQMQEASSAPLAQGVGNADQQSAISAGSALGGGLSSLLSDFNSKEVSRRNLDPVVPTGYQYKPEASERMAREQATQAAALGGGPEAVENVYSLTYADKRAPRDGIVAQDLQKSPTFKDAVVEEQGRLAVNRDRALSTALNELGGLNQRMAELEDSYLSSDNPERKTDFAELEAMLNEKKSQPRGSRAQTASKPMSQAESYVRNRMSGNQGGFELRDETPKLDLKREGSDKVIVIDDNMPSDFDDKVIVLQKRDPKMRRFLLKAAINEMKTEAQQPPQYEPPSVWERFLMESKDPNVSGQMQRKHGPSPLENLDPKKLEKFKRGMLQDPDAYGLGRS